MQIDHDDAHHGVCRVFAAVSGSRRDDAIVKDASGLGQ